MNTLRQDAEQIMRQAIAAVLPDQAVYQALEGKTFAQGRLILIAVGKAGWQMAKAAYDTLGNQITSGVVITKYHHVMGELGHLTCYEAGHPLPDKNSFRATEAALELVRDLQPNDTVLFLLSGGASALFEKPLVPEQELIGITNELLACGADIVEMNTIRKRISAVKGGKFAKLCEPAQVFSIVLSDILGDPLDMIASGPAYPDTSTAQQAYEIVKKYQLHLSLEAMQCLNIELPKTLSNVQTKITGSVRNLCQAGANVCQQLGYRPVILTNMLTCQAKEAGKFLGAIAQTQQNIGNVAYIFGGETVVNLTGSGLGGRNQELALAAAPALDGMYHTALFSFGSDGTDGPTDAAGGYVDGYTAQRLREEQICIDTVLQENDAYHALKTCGGLLITGPTGTNVNDMGVLLIREK